MAEKQYWLDRRDNVTKLFRGLWVIGFLLVVADLVIDRHELVGFAAWLGFYSVYGFVACTCLVLAAKVLRRWVMRPEDYYEH
jgi:hypothetical protein